MIKTYQWLGPITSVALHAVDEDGRPEPDLEPTDVILSPGRAYDLDEQHPWVRSQVAQGFLVSLPVAPEEA